MSWWELGSNSLILISCFMFSGHSWCRPYVHCLHCEMARKCSWCSHPARVRPIWCIQEQLGKASQRTLSWGQWLYAAWLVVYSILKPHYSQGESPQPPPEVSTINCRKSHRNPEEKMAQSPWTSVAAGEGMQGNHNESAWFHTTKLHHWTWKCPLTQIQIVTVTQTLTALILVQMMTITLPTISSHNGYVLMLAKPPGRDWWITTFEIGEYVSSHVLCRLQLFFFFPFFQF